MTRFKHPKFGGIVAKNHSQTVVFDSGWNGMSRKRPFNQISTTYGRKFAVLIPIRIPVQIPTEPHKPLYKPAKRPYRGGNRPIHESRHAQPAVGLVRRVPQETAVRNYFGEGEAVSPYYPQRIVEPVAQQTVEAHVVVPGLVSLIVAVVTTGATAFVCYEQEWGYTLLGYVFPGSFLLTLFWRLGVADNLMQRVEEWTGIDLDRDGYIGDDTPVAPRSIPNRQGETVLQLEDRKAKISGDDWRKFATLLLHHGVNLSRRSIISAGKQFNLHISQGEYQSMYAALNTAGMIDENGLNENGRNWLVAYVPKHLSIVGEMGE